MSGMRCAACGSSKTDVIDSRVNEKGDAVRRRRRCASCGARFSTYEVDSDIFAVAIENSARVSQAREEAIEQFAASLPKPPGANPMRLRPQRRSSG